MLSIPASTATRVAAEDPECAATRAPKRCAASTTARISRGVISALAMSPRSVAMPPEIKILIHEAPRLICRRAALTNSSGPSAYSAPGSAPWPPVINSDSPAEKMRGPWDSPRRIERSRARSAWRRSPGVRIVVTPAWRMSRAAAAMRRASAASLSWASRAAILPGRIRPRCTCIFISPGISHCPR